MMHLLKILVIGLATGAGGPVSSPPLGDGEVRRLIGEAARAMESEQWEVAIERYQTLRDAMPGSPEVLHNLGVAHDRMENFTEAGDLFKSALDRAGDQPLRDRSARSLRGSAFKQAGQDGQAPGTLEDATDKLRTALDHWRRRAAAAPEDVEARRQGEITQQALQQLIQQQQQQEQQQQQDQQQQDQQDQPDQDQQDQQQPPQEGEDEQEQQQPQESEGEQEQQPPQEGADEQQQDQQTAGEQEREQPMSEEEAERLLQAVRDKERQRREEQARRRRARQPPVDKDW